MIKDGSDVTFPIFSSSKVLPASATVAGILNVNLTDSRHHTCPLLSSTFVNILSIASQFSCGALFKISSKNTEKCRRKSKKGQILVLSCLIFVTVKHENYILTRNILPYFDAI